MHGMSPEIRRESGAKVQKLLKNWSVALDTGAGSGRLSCLPGERLFSLSLASILSGLHHYRLLHLASINSY